MIKIKIINSREVQHDVSEIFPDRWSPRAFEDRPITKEQLMVLFEAARWAPSSFNEQPWYFLYALKDTSHWNKLFNLLVDFNKAWAKDSSALILILSRKNSSHNNNPNPMHSFDTGAAWQNLALQASLSGLIAHAMGGFDKDAARKVLNIPQDMHVEAMVAVGYHGDLNLLPADLKEREVKSGRKKVSEFIKEGSF